MKKIFIIILAISNIFIFTAFAYENREDDYLIIKMNPVRGYPLGKTMIICEIKSVDDKTKNKIEEIWNKFIPEFDYKNWNYNDNKEVPAPPDSPFYTIEIKYNNNSISLSSYSIDITLNYKKENISLKQQELWNKQNAFARIAQSCKSWSNARE